MDEPVLTASERAFFEALDRVGLRYLLVGMSAALIQGARGATEAIDVWVESLGDDRIREAARDAGGFFVPATVFGGGMPPMLGGAGLDERIDLVARVDGLGSFDDEYRESREFIVEGIPLRVLELARIIASKRAAGRPKDRAHLAALEEALASREDDESE